MITPFASMSCAITVEMSAPEETLDFGLKSSCVSEAKEREREDDTPNEARAVGAHGRPTTGEEAHAFATTSSEGAFAEANAFNARRANRR